MGNILLSGDGEFLTGLRFEGQKHSSDSIDFTEDIIIDNYPVFKETVKWLDEYFEGKKPSFLPNIKFEGTPFQKEVWELLFKIPYGTAVTYGEIGDIIAAKRGINKMSARAVGNAVARNPIALLIPCHRVLGSNGSITGYAAGINKKAYLLKLENINYRL